MSVAKYVIRLNDQGYFRWDSHYRPVPKAEATVLDRTRAWAVKGKLRRLGYTTATIEVAPPPQDVLDLAAKKQAQPPATS